jgi:hypothetical protein
MQELEEKIAKQHEGLAMELLGEVKKQTKRWFVAFCIVVCVEVVTVCSFIFYLNQYDFSSTIEQNGVYTIIDSDGNVISADISADKIEEIMEIINDGVCEDDQEQDEKER